MYWPEFAKLEPELADRGRTLLAEAHGYVFLATIRRDGSPRLHPIVPILSDRGLAHNVPGEQARQAAVAGSGTEAPPDVMVPFEVELTGVSWATWPEQGHPIRQHWPKKSA